MKIIRAAEMGMCFGVRDALQITSEVADPSEVTIHGELVHNPTVIRDLAQAGFHQSAEADRGGTPPTPLVLITAHGISNAERERLRANGKQMIDTTCPLVRRVHDAAIELESERRHVLLIGKRGHVEVQGIIEDLKSYDVVAHPDEVTDYHRERLGVVCQTTMPSQVAVEVLARVEQLNPNADIRFVDTVCHPTKRRQQAMLELIDQVDLVVVVGGRNSNNTRRLVELSEHHDVPAIHVTCADEIDPGRFENVESVGLTAGTSTLDDTIEGVHRELMRIASQVTCERS